MNDNSIKFPSLAKRGWGDFLKKLFVKSPLIPLFQRGRLERRTFHKRAKIWKPVHYLPFARCIKAVISYLKQQMTDDPLRLL
jgi:hypothetical protein